MAHQNTSDPSIEDLVHLIIKANSSDAEALRQLRLHALVPRRFASLEICHRAVLGAFAKGTVCSLQDLIGQVVQQPEQTSMLASPPIACPSPPNYSPPAQDRPRYIRPRCSVCDSFAIPGDNVCFTHSN
ncbi:hypothetical protein [uncultured Azohydromonas sp.]|jgi:hypothetical protein|uniref:hypothetical protein n=1 Tax=uncultured Azohydromonas sp. TaxID=487342 RepID=UPI002626CF1C|nr:hypothetical protein [uncultured Azohydromonas sp.]